MLISDQFPIEPHEILYVFALESEAGEYFHNHSLLFTGIGKVNATYNLTKQLYKKRPKLIVNLGTAGSNVFSKGTVVVCTSFIQRDMDVRSLGFSLFETPLSGLPVELNTGQSWNGLQEAVCGSGDSFDTNLQANQYQVVDMEAYALASVALQENIPFLCLKYISDGADESSPEDWTLEVTNAAKALAGVVFNSQKADSTNLLR